MNKKGQIELADLAGFILIFIAVIIFGYIFLRLSPKSNIELLKDDYHDYSAKLELLEYLEYEIDGRNIADWVVLGAKNDDLNGVDKKNKKYFDGRYGGYDLTIQRGKVLLKERYNTNWFEIRGLKETFFSMFLENPFGEDIYITLSYYI